MIPASTEIQNTFSDVRTAYRLLHDYQRLVLDSVSYLSNQLGLRYVGGWPKFSAVSPRRGSGGLDYWAWDWLNLIAYDFHFLGSLETEDDLGFSAFLISDTGYFCSDNDKPEKTDTTSFLPANKSRSLIGFIMSMGDWEAGYMEDAEAMKVFIEQDGKIIKPYARDGTFSCCFDLERLVSEPAVNELIDELIQRANQAGIPLKRRDFKE